MNTKEKTNAELYNHEINALVEYGETEYKTAELIGATLIRLMASIMTCKTPEMKDTLRKMCYRLIDGTTEIESEAYSPK